MTDETPRIRTASSADLVRLTRGVHRPASQLPDLSARAAATLTACSPGSIVTGVAAAQIVGLWLPPLPTGEPTEVILRGLTGQQPRARSRSKRPEVRARRRALAPEDVTMIDGVALTSVARTWFELATQLRLPDLVAAGDSALRGGTSLEEIDRLLARCAHTPGIVRARAARKLLNARSRSRPESHMRVALVLADLPEPEVNEPVFDEWGQWVFEPDLGYRDARLAIEYRGEHHADRLRMRRDMTRSVDGYLRGGWQVIEFGPTEVFRRVDQFVAMVRQLWEERLRLVAGSPLPGQWRLRA